MHLDQLSYEELLQLIEDIRTQEHLTENLRNVIATEYVKELGRVTLTDMIAFSWEVAKVLADRMMCYKNNGINSTIGNLP